MSCLHPDLKLRMWVASARGIAWIGALVLVGCTPGVEAFGVSGLHVQPRGYSGRVSVHVGLSTSASETKILPLSMTLGQLDLGGRGWVARGVGDADLVVSSYLDSVSIPVNGDLDLSLGLKSGAIRLSSTVPGELLRGERGRRAQSSVDIVTSLQNSEVKDHFPIGQEIVLSLTLMNISDGPLVITIGNCPDMNYKVVRGQEEIWDWQDFFSWSGIACPDTLPSKVEIPIGGLFPSTGTKYGVAVWNQRDHNQKPVPPGQYRIVAISDLLIEERTVTIDP